MRLALLWALGILGAGSPVPSGPLLDTGQKGEQFPPPKGPPGGYPQPQVLRGNLTVDLSEVLQDRLPQKLQIKLELQGKSHILELQQNGELVPDTPTLVWYQPDGTQVVNEGETLENCCYQGTAQDHPDSWVSVCTCSGLRGLVVLSPENIYTLDPEPWGVTRISKIEDIHLSGGTCALNPGLLVFTQAQSELKLGPHHLYRSKRDVVSETKFVELVIVADHEEVQRYPDLHQLQTRMLEVANQVDAFFRPLNVRVALVGIEVWNEKDMITMDRDAGITLERFLHWRQAELLPRLPHDSAQLVTTNLFLNSAVGMAVQNSICSPSLSGGVNVDHSVSILGVASTMAHELGHSLGLAHDLPGGICPCPGQPPAKSCIMEAATAFLPGLSFSNCSREALEKSLLRGAGGCLFSRPSQLAPRPPRCGNLFVEPGEQCDCGFWEECSDPCCNASSCQLMPGAQCASDGLCCQECQLRPVGWLCRPAREDCDLPEFCSGDSAQCPSDVSLGDGEPCAGGRAVCAAGHCASYTAQCQALWGPGAHPATPLCLQAANIRGDSFGNCGKQSNGSYVPCTPRDASCGQLQCQGGRVHPLLGTTQDTLTETVEVNGTRQTCQWTHLDLGSDVAQPILALMGTTCGPGQQVCIDQRCQPLKLLGAEECRSKCHGHGVCNSNGHCHCDQGWAPPDCSNQGFGGSVDSGALGQQPKANGGLTTGLLLSLLLLALLMLLGACYWHRTHLRRRLCQFKGTSSQYRDTAEAQVRFLHGVVCANGYRASPAGPPERPDPPQRTQATELQLMSSTKSGALGHPDPPSRPLPPDPVPKRLQAALTDRPNPPTRPLPADPVVRSPQSQGPAKPPPPRKPLPFYPQGRLEGPAEDSSVPLVIPSRPAPPPPTASGAALRV
ncbi:disintegrin and metalloproteinase domain-containing protein 15 isoform X1 [Macrotis lagotis]|uniref:disintegrin and metalloproteinase domain-containing protein 15 isoform X1 n=1 Tax=Macrotis lagotis TaxID=92651 RepID=UPI003D6941E1